MAQQTITITAEEYSQLLSDSFTLETVILYGKLDGVLEFINRESQSERRAEAIKYRLEEFINSGDLPY